MPFLIPYELTLEPREGYLYARIEAEKITGKTSVEYLSKIADECRRLGLAKLIVDRHIRYAPTTVAFYNISQASVEILSRIKTAWVNPYPELREELEFAMNVAVNRGAQYQLFSTRLEAEDWLLHDSPKPPDDPDGWISKPVSR